MRTCTIDGCQRKHQARGLCRAHYHRLLRYGTADGTPPANDKRGPLRKALECGDHTSVIRALLDDTVLDAGCRLWQRRMHKGYPEVLVAGRTHAVHRMMAAAWQRAALSPAQAVHHRCSNAACIEPTHLQITTHDDNLAEMLRRRHYLARIEALEAALKAIDPNHAALTTTAT